jgi:hypothetical protein
MPTLEEIVVAHREQHPEAEPLDLYKLAHQGTQGVGHMLLEDTTDPATSIIEELSGIDLEPKEWEPVVEPISHTSDLARVHLRPYVRAGGDPRRLAAAMIATAEAFPGDPERLAELLGALRPLLRSKWPKLDPHRFDKLLREQAEAGFPTVSHSATFRDLYDPHYRVVSLSMLAKE